MEVAACSWEYVPERDNVFAFPNASLSSEMPAKMKCPNCKISVYFTKKMSATLFKRESPRINGIQYTAKDLVEESNKQDLSLLIICKSRMNKGNCYIGLSLEKQKLYRPIFSETESQCCWPKQSSSSMEVGGFYGFQHIYRHPKTEFPHNNDDLIVKRHYEDAKSNTKLDTIEGHLEKALIFDKLLPLAKHTVSDIFGKGNFVKKSNGKCYTKPGVDCNSIGVLNVKTFKTYEDFDGKRLVEFTDKTGQTFVAKWTGEENINSTLELFSHKLLILGLGRPWSKDDPIKKCWMMAIGLFTKFS